MRTLPFAAQCVDNQRVQQCFDDRKAAIAVGVLLRPSIDPRSLALAMLGITAACLLLSISAALLINPAKTEGLVHVPSVDLESGSVIPAPVTRDIELA